MSLFKRGFLKHAQVGDVPVEAPPEEDNKETVVTCMSDCVYAQNPEKRCMLENISLAMDEGSGTLSCGQYAPNQSMEPGVEGPEVAQPQQEAPIKKQPGLPGTPVQQ